MEYYEKLIDDLNGNINPKQQAHLQNFNNNLREGISYYLELFTVKKDKFKDVNILIQDLKTGALKLDRFDKLIGASIL